MNRNFQRALSLVLKSEGGFVDDPRDPGGATNKGITLATYHHFVNPHATVADLKRMTEAELSHIYRRQYWDAVNGDGLPDGIDYATFDFAVNSGPSRAARYLQTVVGAKADGIVGPATVMACQNRNSRKVVQELCAKRLAFLKGLSAWGTFGRGWSARITSVDAEAIAMMGAGNAQTVAPDPVARPASQPAIARPEARPSHAASAGAALGVAAVASLIATYWHSILHFLGF